MSRRREDSPVKNGWQLEQMSTRNSFLVEPVVQVLPQEAQVTFASGKYVGWISAFNWNLHLNDLRNNVDSLLSVGDVIHHDTRGNCHQGIIRAGFDVQARLDLGAALAHKDVARQYKLTRVTLDAQTLGI